MSVDAWMLGAPSLLPFRGHLRLVVRSHRASLALAGRVATDDGLDAAYAVSERLRAVLSAAADGAWQDTDRHGLIRRVWQLLGDVPPTALGSAHGADLSLIMLGVDGRGVSVTGVGLSGAWGWLDGHYRALVAPGHPLLSQRGLPAGLPGVLTLEQPCGRVVAAPRPQEPVLPALDRVARRCGVRQAPEAS